MNLYSGVGITAKNAESAKLGKQVSIVSMLLMSEQFFVLFVAYLTGISVSPLW
ncbi:MAG: hypothetical protein KA257_10570 [Opitutaceae bacterium]|nr:hypothetical protein [Opitutaceae bacterium]MBP9912435.1 hypothetical protein [Opitutaceae bacterium]